jgi:hypothetical protein
MPNTKIVLPKDKLEELYINNRLSSKEIGKIFNCSYRTVIERIHEYGIVKEYKTVKDFTGYRFDKLLVIGKVNENEKLNSRTKWKCICKCGRHTESLISNLLYRNIRSCGHCSVQAKKYEELHYEFFYRIKQNASKRGHEFDLSIEYIWDLFIKQNRKCSISGLNITLRNKRDSKCSASIDRIDSTKGYIKGNVQWVHKLVNRMKMQLQDNEFIQLCNCISYFQKNKNANVCNIDNIKFK